MKKLAALMCGVLLLVSIPIYVMAEGDSGNTNEGLIYEGVNLTDESEFQENTENYDEFTIIQDVDQDLSVITATVAGSPTVDEISVSLMGNICVNIVCTIPSSIVSQSGAYVKVNDDIYYVSQLEKSAGRYIIKANIAAKDYDKKISVSFCSSNGNTIQIMNTAGSLVDNIEFSVAAYITKILSGDYSSNTKAVAEALQNYCNYAKTYFNNASVVTPSQSIQTSMSNVSASTLSSYQMKQTVLNSNFVFLGQSIILENTTLVRFYFTMAEGKKVSDYTFKIGGVTVTPAKIGGVYYIDSQPLAATELTKKMYLEVYAGSTKIISYTVYGAASYMYMALSEDASEELKNVVKALYVYGQAAKSAQEAAAVVDESIPASEGNATVYTGIDYTVKAVGQYVNWDGVSNVAEFLDNEGNYCFAYDSTDYVVVIKTVNGVQVGTLNLKKQHSIFGAVICDSNGYYYVVTGQTGTNNPEDETVFISKYDSKGNHINTVGNNGSSSLGYWYGTKYYTCIPFDGGTCDVAINGNKLAVNYAREMYSGHQSNSVWIIDTTTMETQPTGTTKTNCNIYNSHSFSQRVIPLGDGFAFASQGDCFPRALTINILDGTRVFEGDIFHFWVQDGAYDNYNMSQLNPTYATMGDMVLLANKKIGYVGSSVRSLSSEALTQKRDVYIQIFDSTMDFTKESAYITTGTRSGLGGNNGRDSVTDYGVKWLTSDTSKTYKNPQAVSDGDDTIVVLYEQYSGSTYNGVYYIVLNGKGEITTPTTLFSATAKLNSCQTPIWKDGKVYWTANQYGNGSKLYNYILVP